jgi:hypothetical protein
MAYGADTAMIVCSQQRRKGKAKIFFANVLTLHFYFVIIMLLEFTNEYTSREDV